MNPVCKKIWKTQIRMATSACSARKKKLIIDSPQIRRSEKLKNKEKLLRHIL